MSDEIRRAVGLLAPEGVVEVRALADGATHSGYFDDHEALARAVEALDADPAVAGIYVTLNTVNPALLARRANQYILRFRYRCGGPVFLVLAGVGTRGAAVQAFVF